MPLYQWLHANAAFAVVAICIAVWTLYRLAVRGRWLVIVAVLLSWAVLGTVAWLLR